MFLLHFLFLLSLSIFLLATIGKIVKILKLPVNLRVELYPIPGDEIKGINYNNHQQNIHIFRNFSRNLIKELIYIFEEVVFLKSVWKNNRLLWFGAISLHIGVYLYFALLFLVIIKIFLFMSLTLPLDVITFVSSIMGCLGAVFLIFLRILNRNYRIYSKPSHFFNLVLLSILFFSFLLWVLKRESFASEYIAFYSGLLTFTQFKEISFFAIFHFIVLALFLAYLPFSQMNHFVIKFFTFHKMRWETKTTFEDRKLKEKIMEQWKYPINWTAPHVVEGGSKTWLALSVSQEAHKKTKKDEAEN
ncbi:MAG: hypothetical protein N2517_08495 [Ignavibacteria bacterium]|nr:hypothetical protein [Ignavibacteria bacterium]